nr:unnamed protein product [Digitaria exilis]
MGGGLLRSIDVREAEELAANGVADKARGVGVHVDTDQSASTGGAVAADDWSGGAAVAEVEEQEAVAAHGADAAAEEAHGVAVGVGAGPRVDEVAGDEDVGGARRLDELE